MKSKKKTQRFFHLVSFFHTLCLHLWKDESVKEGDQMSEKLERGKHSEAHRALILFSYTSFTHGVFICLKVSWSWFIMFSVSSLNGTPL